MIISTRCAMRVVAAIPLPAGERRSQVRFLIGRSMLNCPLAVMSNQVKKPAPEANFEQAMQRLETIVEEMESGELPLEDLIVRYEEGMKLVKICQERLASAEQRIEIITRNSAGKPVVKKFEPAAVAQPEPQGKPKNVDVSLF
jgi:exodeoxyribonuclease VII small subunit